MSKEKRTRSGPGIEPRVGMLVQKAGFGISHTRVIQEPIFSEYGNAEAGTVSRLLWDEGEYYIIEPQEPPP